MKHLKESILSDDIENTAKKDTGSEKVMEKKLEVMNTVFYGLPTNKFKYHISSNKLLWHLLNFETVRCRAY